MAIEFAHSSVISRGKGHTAVKAAAYRSGSRLNDSRIGRVADYSHRSEQVLHKEILLPTGAPSHLLDRETLWNAVENREDLHNRRDSAQLAIDHVIALPIELTVDQQIQLAKAFAESMFVSRGLVVDLAIHGHSEGNPHAHLMTTTRVLEGNEFTRKDREGNGKFHGGQKIVDEKQLRHHWADFQNTWIQENTQEAGILVINNDGDVPAERHMGPAHHLEKRGFSSVAVEQRREAILSRDRAVFYNPDLVLRRIAAKKSVFRLDDVYRQLSALVSNDTVFSQIKAKLDVSPELVKIGQADNGKSLYTTREILQTELDLDDQLSEMVAEDDANHLVDQAEIESAILSAEVLSEEQADAVRHTLSSNRLSNVVGFAGTGKSTLLQTVNTVLTGQGRAVYGVALSGKAAEGLEMSSGISSRTLASFLARLENADLSLSSGDSVILDEAGMVASATLEKLVSQVNRAGAKLIMVGDPAQLQPIQAGSPFRSSCEKFGAARIETIRRQTQDWQKEASQQLAVGDVWQAIEAYQSRGFVRTHSDAIGSLVSDYLASDVPMDQRVALAHRNSDITSLNKQIRAGLIEQGRLGESRLFALDVPADIYPEIGAAVRRIDSAGSVTEKVWTYGGQEDGITLLIDDDGVEYRESISPGGLVAADGKDSSNRLALAIGERLLFTKNDTEIGVKNGSLGTLQAIEDNRTLAVKLDESDKVVRFNLDAYSSIQHSYATTIHKAQGITVDDAFVLGSESMDRHLSYVAMTRHRDTLRLYLPEKKLTPQRSEERQNALEIAAQSGLDIRQFLANQEEGIMSASIASRLTQSGTEPGKLDVNQLAKGIEKQLGAALEDALSKATIEVRDAQRALDKARKGMPKRTLFNGKKYHFAAKRVERRQATLEKTQETLEKVRTRIEEEKPTIKQRAQEQALKQVQRSTAREKPTVDIGKLLDALDEAVERHQTKPSARLRNEITVLTAKLNRQGTLSAEQRARVSVVEKALERGRDHGLGR